MGQCRLVGFVASVVFFHLSEYLLAWKYQRRSGDITWRNALVSLPLFGAYGASTLEFLARPRQSGAVGHGVGLAMIVLGEVVRKAAIVTAGTSFTHQIAHTHREEDHRLVTHGVYAWHRHPGYVGFFLFCVGTQVYLGNWICMVVFTAILYRFFDRRIAFEESTLVGFFGSAYQDYASKTSASPWRGYEGSSPQSLS
jgi:protein-S-isoprenylcysteine O-methyltransferase